MHPQRNPGGASDPNNNAPELLNDPKIVTSSLTFLHHPQHHGGQQTSHLSMEEKWNSGDTADLGKMEAGQLMGFSLLDEPTGEVTYRLSQQETETARTVSRPEMVVEGLEEMCNLVKYKEPELPFYNTRSRYRFGHPTMKISSPPIPPPTAFHAGLDDDLGEDEASFDFEPNSRERIGHGHGHSHPGQLGDEVDLKMCDVLNKMISHVSTFDESGGPSGNDYPDAEECEGGGFPVPMSYRSLDKGNSCKEHVNATVTPGVGKQQKVVEKLEKQSCSCQCDFSGGASVNICNDKSTSTNDVPFTPRQPLSPFPQQTYPFLQFSGQVQNQMSHSQQPIYILQPAPSIQGQCQCQCQPIFLYGGAGTNGPTSNCACVNSGNQTPLIFQPVQFQQVQQGQLPNIFQPQQQHMQQSQQVTLQATRVETTTSTTVPSQPTEGMSRYIFESRARSHKNLRPLREVDRVKSLSPPRSNLRKKQSHHDLLQQVKAKSERKPHHQIPRGHKASVSGGHENGKEEVHFIVGPSPVESNLDLTRNNHTKIKNAKYVSATSDPGKLKSRNTEEWVSKTRQASHSATANDTGKNARDLKPTKPNEQKLQVQQQRRNNTKNEEEPEDDFVEEHEQEEEEEHYPNPRMRWTLHRSKEEADISVAREALDETDENLQAASPATSSHTIVIKRGYDDDLQDGSHHPYITSGSDQEFYEDAPEHDEPLPLKQVTSTESYSSVEMLHKAAPTEKKKGNAPKTATILRNPQHDKVETEQEEIDLDLSRHSTDLDLHASYIDEKPGFMRDKKKEEKYDHVEKSVAEGIAMIEDVTSWERNVCGLKVITLQLRFEENGVLEHLPQLVAMIQKHVRASGSKLARQAISTLRELFAALGPHFDAYLNTLAERLFSKMANTNKFIKDECEATLEAMVTFCSHPKMIQILESVARRHKHAMIRLVACRMVTKFIMLVEPNVALQEYADLVLPLLCSNLVERTREVRDEARNAIKYLITNPSFDSYLRQYVSPQFIYSICEKIERIREEVSGKPKIKRKISRNQCMFKWQMNDNQNQNLRK